MTGVENPRYVKVDDIFLDQVMESEQPLHPQSRTLEPQPDMGLEQPFDPQESRTESQPQSNGRDWQEFRKLIQKPIPFAVVHRRRAARLKKL